MFLGCTTSPEGRLRKNVKYLVYDLKPFEGNVRRLFELSAVCLSQEASNDEKHADTSSDESRHTVLFQHKAPVPMMGRQTYRMWKASLDLSFGFPFKSNLLDKPKTLHFFPLEHFPPSVTSGFGVQGFENLVHYLVHFLRMYFPNMEVVLEPLRDINDEDLDLVSRYHSKTKRKQFLATDLYAKLHKLTGTPRNDFILGFTWTDLYPKEELNFVLGEASFQHRCAVLSFGRYEPLIYEAKDLICKEDVHGAKEIDEESVVVDGDLMWKLLRVVTHETSHLFGLNHCVFFECSMNESKSVSEALAQPLFLCPVCLRKMQRFLKFDVVERYRGLLSTCQTLQDVYPSDGLAKTVAWLQRCIEFLS